MLWTSPLARLDLGDDTPRMQDDVVWWSDTGRTLHRDPDCPPFMRARARAIFTGTFGIRSYDFRAKGALEAVYPPEHLLLCGLCGGAGRNNGSARARRRRRVEGS
jgi:hypothetical protein